MAINPSYSYADRMAGMPFKHPENLVWIANGLDRAGLLSGIIQS